MGRGRLLPFVDYFWDLFYPLYGYERLPHKTFFFWSAPVLSTHIDRNSSPHEPGRVAWPRPLLTVSKQLRTHTRTARRTVGRLAPGEFSFNGSDENVLAVFCGCCDNRNMAARGQPFDTGIAPPVECHRCFNTFRLRRPLRCKTHNLG